MIIEPTGEAFPIVIPAFSEEDAARAGGFSVAVCCPMGCHHVVAAEVGWSETLEMASHRLESAPGHKGFLVAACYPPGDAERFAQVKASTDAHFRGRVR